MGTQNCWEFFNCGRHPGGSKVKEMGICPAALNTTLNKVNGGTNGGRCCWSIAGTLCKGEVQGTYALKLGGCLRCEFFASVRFEQSDKLVSTRDILNMLKENKA